MIGAERPDGEGVGEVVSPVTEVREQDERSSHVPSVDLVVWRERLRLALYGREPGEEVTPHRVELPELTHAEAGGALRRNALLVAAALAGLVGATLIAATAPVYYLAPASWRLTLPGVPHPGSSVFSAGSFLVGAVLLGLGWVGLVGRSERQVGGERRRLVVVAAVFALWCVPIMLGPPLLSKDVYSYVAQGELASRGIDPTSHGPVYLGRGQIMSAADPIWRTSPAPYGPVAIEAGKQVVQLSGHDPAKSIWGFRLVALAGIAMAGVGVALIAKRKGVSPALAVAIGIANPLVLIHLLGGAHNDALMLGLLALGLAAFTWDRRALGVLLVALATAVKLPAAIALVYIGWNWTGDEVSFRRRVRDTAALVGGVFVGLGVLSVLTGIGAGWVTALRNTGKITSTFSFTTKLGFVLGDGLNLVGIRIDDEKLVALLRLAGLALTAVIALVVLLRSPRLGVVRSVGVVMIAFILLGPVLWPWYLPAGFALLAAVGLGRHRPSLMVVCFAASLLVWPTSVNPVMSLSRYQHLLGLGVMVLIALAAFGAQRWSDRTYRRRARAAGIELDEPEAEVQLPAEPADTSRPVTV